MVVVAALPQTWVNGRCCGCGDGWFGARRSGVTPSSIGDFGIRELLCRYVCVFCLLLFVLLGRTLTEEISRTLAAVVRSFLGYSCSPLSYSSRGGM